ncbi:LysR family transcriptional regulator [Leucobacter sp. L43]|uniref:LysR family transcriptional regulator n=1 Tax=Leucobacter sp. L43 TaxID=2798040 RepID=UPI001905C2B3|nr:LysR family transcriptional regulator [Leucobacter sp. L43]
MTLTQLHAFLAAVNGGSFTAAARELKFSQPAISDLVRRLEEELQAALFVRGPRKLTLTAAGEELLPHARQTVASATAASASVLALNRLEGGNASFGLLRNADYYHLSDLVIDFHALHPLVSVKLVGQNSAETVRSVVNGELESGLVVLNGEPKGLHVERLVRDEVVHISPGSAGITEPLSIEATLERPLILYDASHGATDPTRGQIAARARAVGKNLESKIEVERVETAIGLVAAGHGETFACRAVTQAPQFPQNLVVHSYDPPVYDVIALVKRKDHALSPATRDFARLAIKTLRSHISNGTGSWEMY